LYNQLEGREEEEDQRKGGLKSKNGRTKIKWRGGWEELGSKVGGARGAKVK
jgi:hypothetical protein